MGARSSNPLEAAGPIREPIKIGVLHSLTGTMAISEQAVVDATILAIDAINEKGGLLGRQIEPIIRDSQSDAQVFVNQADELIKPAHACDVYAT